MNFFFFFKYKTYTSFEPHLLYKQEMLQWMLYFFQIFFLFSVVHRSCKQSAIFFFFFLLILTKKKKKKTSFTGRWKEKVNSSGVGLNVAGVQTLGMKHKEVFRWRLLEKWCTWSFCGQFVTHRLGLSHCMVPNDMLTAPHHMTWQVSLHVSLNPMKAQWIAVEYLQCMTLCASAFILYIT